MCKSEGTKTEITCYCASYKTIGRLLEMHSGEARIPKAQFMNGCRSQTWPFFPVKCEASPFKRRQHEMENRWGNRRALPSFLFQFSVAVLPPTPFQGTSSWGSRQKFITIIQGGGIQGQIKYKFPTPGTYFFSNKSACQGCVMYICVWCVILP